MIFRNMLGESSDLIGWRDFEAAYLCFQCGTTSCFNTSFLIFERTKQRIFPFIYTELT